jgi:HTH-type transcriptional regulator / antitoxin HipB
MGKLLPITPILPYGKISYRSIAFCLCTRYCYRSISMTVGTPRDYGRRLRARRRELRLSQTEVADAIGVNRRVIGELESGKPTVRLEIAIDAARAIGLDLELTPRQ